MAEGEREFLNARADVRVSVDEYRELDSQRVLVPLHGSGRGKTSGLDFGRMSDPGASLFISVTVVSIGELTPCGSGGASGSPPGR
jgi:hypothetical protein